MTAQELTYSGPAKRLSVYLIRHGQTAWSLSRRHAGTTDLPLTVHGEDEARALAPWLGAIRFSRVFVSPRLRARRTCELAGLDAAAAIEPDLAEWDYGDYEGQLSVDICSKRPGWSVFHDGCPRGELPDQICVRADRLIARLCDMDGNVALFSHAQFGSSLAARWIGMPVAKGQQFELGTASLSILGYNLIHTEPRVIALWNATPAVLARTRCKSQSGNGL